MVAACFGVRRRVSAENLGTQENKSKSTWIADQDKKIRDLQARNDQLERENASLLGRVEKLSAELEAVQARLDIQTEGMRRIERLLIRARPEFREVLGSGFGALDETR